MKNYPKVTDTTKIMSSALNIKKQLQTFFQGYIACFKHYDIEVLHHYYQLPCTLSTPDKLVLVTSNEMFEKEFLTIFTQLQNANTCECHFNNISYTQVSNSMTLIGGHWAFMNDQQEIFAEFFACYHILTENNHLKIVNVMSHAVENKITFTEVLALTADDH